MSVALPREYAGVSFRNGRWRYSITFGNRTVRRISRFGSAIEAARHRECYLHASERPAALPHPVSSRFAVLLPPVLIGPKTAKKLNFQETAPDPASRAPAASLPSHAPLPRVQDRVAAARREHEQWALKPHHEKTRKRGRAMSTGAEPAPKRLRTVLEDDPASQPEERRERESKLRAADAIRRLATYVDDDSAAGRSFAPSQESQPSGEGGDEDEETEDDEDDDDEGSDDDASSSVDTAPDHNAAHDADRERQPRDSLDLGGVRRAVASLRGGLDRDGRAAAEAREALQKAEQREERAAVDVAAERAALARAEAEAREAAEAADGAKAELARREAALNEHRRKLAELFGARDELVALCALLPPQ
jgi:hypothetical protein